MFTVRVGETGPLRPILRTTLSPRSTLDLVVKPPRFLLYSLTSQPVEPVLHWFSLTTGLAFGQVAALALAGPIAATRRKSAIAQAVSRRTVQLSRRWIGLLDQIR